MFIIILPAELSSSVYRDTCRTTVVHFCVIIDEVFPSKLTNREQMHFLYISRHDLISEAFKAILLLNFAFEAVAVYSPPPVF